MSTDKRDILQNCPKWKKRKKVINHILIQIIFSLKNEPANDSFLAVDYLGTEED